jgi:hypothetical protein
LERVKFKDRRSKKKDEKKRNKNCGQKIELGIGEEGMQ